MCGRFTLSTDAQHVSDLFDLREPPPLEPRYNIAPSQPIPSLFVDKDDADRQRQFAFFHWGLIPPWADDPAIGNRLINARGETLAEKSAFKKAFLRRRCLILADGFYEWKKLDPQRMRSPKQPYHIRLADGEPFAFAGLYEHYQDENGNEIDSATIITTEPNELLATIHNRMPVILPRADYDVWLDPGNTDLASLQALLRAYPAEEMTASPVSRRVSNPKNDDPGCIEPEQGSLF